MVEPFSGWSASSRNIFPNILQRVLRLDNVLGLEAAALRGGRFAAIVRYANDLWYTTRPSRKQTVWAAIR